jgi:two-component system NarL family sensor kinase
LLNNGLEIAQNKNTINQQQQELTINLLEIRNNNQLVKNQKIDAERKNENIKNLQRQAQIQQLRLAKRNTLIITISFIALLSALISYLLYNRYKIKQKALLEAEVFKQQEIAAQSLFDGEQKERIRIARDLHDSIGQMLSVVKMNISSMDDIEVENSLSNNTASLVDKTIEEVRHISHNLIPEELNFGLFNALESLCEKINKSKKTKATLDIPDSVKHYVFEKENELSIYRIVQEVLNNMVKHAEANCININILQNEKQLVIQVKDDGKGFNAQSIHESKGLGWKNIQARVKMLNGKLEITSEKLTGTEIEISIPEWNKRVTT